MVYRVLGYCDTTLYNDLQIGIVDWIFQASDLAEVLGQVRDNISTPILSLLSTTWKYPLLLLIYMKWR